MEMTQEETEEIFEATMTENLPKSTSDTKPQIQETRRTQSRIKRHEGQSKKFQQMSNWSFIGT